MKSSPSRNAPSHHYEEEFWKLKAQRLQANNQELSKENQTLVKKSIECSKREQELIDKLASQTALIRSRRNEDKESDTAKEEIERLGKELRVLKNEYSIETIRAAEENRKLKKKLAELDARQLSWVSADEHSNKVRALNQEITTLTKRLTISQQQLQRLRQEKNKLLTDIDSLGKELNMAKARQKAVQKKQEENLMDLRKYEQFIHQYKTQKEHSPKQTKQQAQEDHSQELAKLRKQISILEKQRQSSRKMYMEIASWQHDKTRTETKLKQMQSQLSDAKTQLKNVLTKLAPLIGQKSQLKGKQNVEAKASLTLLQIFLKKHKIQAF